MPDLSLLEIRPVYDSADCHLVNDLIIPLLSHSIEYCRGVGYFSSGWLKIAASGLAALASNGGTARLVMSPILEERDWKAIVLGHLARQSDVLRKTLERSLEELAQSLETDTINTFAWMIADGLIDIKLAVARAGYKGGDYHDKVAYFRDSCGNIVAIHGSFNDSIKGTLNGEAFSVFRSWESGQKAFVTQHVQRLDRLWCNENPQFLSFELPEAIRQQIVQLRNTCTRPYEIGGALKCTPEQVPHIPQNLELYDYQCEAIQAWQANNCCGIFEMATGSGKTYTALGAGIKELENRRKLAIVILVPYLHLLYQWKDDCLAFGFQPVLCGSSCDKWQSALRSAISDFRLSGNHLCVIAVHQTATTKSFLRAFDYIPETSKMLIADEVHALGACQLRKALQNSFKIRLGLSATPRRWYDDAGTGILFDYFDKICYEFSLNDAINRDFLVPYQYKPQLVNLTQHEETTISELSSLIGQLFAKQATHGLMEIEQLALEKALRNRALVVKQAANKITALTELLDQLRSEHVDFRHSLFYSPEGRHGDILQLLKREGIMCHQFIGEDSPSARQQILEDFDKGRIMSLVAMKCLDEGVDVPSTQSAFFMSSTTNPREFIQRRGRVLRRFPGKSRASIYDFVVVPSLTTPDDVACYILQREMPRFAEFADTAENSFTSRSILRPLLDKYQMLHLLDMKPWDVYRTQRPEMKDETR